MSDFTSYWTNDTLKEMEGNDLGHAASNLFAHERAGDRVAPDDTVWLLSFEHGDLLLIGRILVGEVLSERAARQRLGSNIWQARWHILAKPGTKEPVRRVVVTGLVPHLRFTGRNPRVTHLDQQSFRALRELTPQSADLLAEALGTPGRGAQGNTSMKLPKTTEVQGQAVQRIGQEQFRARLLDYWGGRCAISGLDVPDLLRASHIKPWAESTSGERLDVYNGLLLAAHLDVAFDLGFITLDDDGTVVVSEALSPRARRALGLSRTLRVQIEAGHRRYLAVHRARLRA